MSRRGEARSRQLATAYERLRHSMDAGDKLRRELTRAIARKEVEIAERTAELEEANNRLRDLSKTDGLTGLANRRKFDSFERRVWGQCARDGAPVSVIMLDVDLFRIFNDRLGHQEGDACLRQVAEAIGSCAARPLDIVARYGGEESVAMLGNTKISDALVIAERMRLEVCELSIPHPGSPHEAVSVSVGVASLVPSADGDPAQLVKTADEALYYAKAGGRNCVVYHADDEFVAFHHEDIDVTATNVIEILTGRVARLPGSTRRN